MRCRETIQSGCYVTVEEGGHSCGRMCGVKALLDCDGFFEERCHETHYVNVPDLGQQREEPQPIVHQ